MNITSKEDAQALADLHAEEDALRYIRRLEASIANWDGRSELTITVPHTELAILHCVKTQYENMGWKVSISGGVNKTLVIS